MENFEHYTVLMSLYYKERPEYLDECLASLSKQTIKPDQIVIVYDGIIDENLDAIVQKWLSILKICVVPLDKNIGLGKALNEGLKHCKYDLVARMDTDDICLPQRFEQQLSHFAADPTLSLHSGYIKEYDSQMKHQTGLRKVPLTEEEILHFCKKKNPFNHMAVMFRKSVIEKLGGYQHHLFMEDYNLWIRLLSAGYKGKNSSSVLVHARAGSAMLERRKGLAYIKSEWQLAKLKMDVGLTSSIEAIPIFLIRSLPRLFPTFVLKLVYAKIRS